MTSSEDVMIREVDEDLSQDRQLAFFRRYGPALAAAAALLLIAVGVFQYLEAQRSAARAEAAAAYVAVVEEGAAPDALMQFASVAEGGYRQLALMRAATALAERGERVPAIEAYARVYDAEGTPTALADLARLRAAYLAVEDAGPEGGAGAAEGIAAGVTTEAFAPFVREVSALAALARGDHAGAAAGFEEAATAEGAPPTLTLRAGQLAALARTGAAGIALDAPEGEADFIDSFTRRLQEGAAPSEPVPEPAPEPVSELAPEVPSERAPEVPAAPPE